jgi:hypothetical protein
MRRLAALVIACAVGGCTSVLAPAMPEGAPDRGGWQDCEPPYAFDGMASLRELGIPDMGPDAGRRGQVRITRDFISHREFAPPGAPVEPGMPGGQVVCVEWPDGSGMASMLSERWEPSGGPAVSGDQGTPLALVSVGLVVAVGGVVSWLAFRRPEEPAPPR